MLARPIGVFANFRLRQQSNDHRSAAVRDAADAADGGEEVDSAGDDVDAVDVAAAVVVELAVDVAEVRSRQMRNSSTLRVHIRCSVTRTSKKCAERTQKACSNG